MKLDVSMALRFPGRTFPFEAVQSIAPQDINGDVVEFDDAVMQGTFLGDEDGNVTLDGTITTVAHGHCAHCLEPAQTAIQASYRETFLREGDPEDDEIFTYGGYRIELDKLAMTYAVMELPIRMLCREDCQGWGGFKIATDDGRNPEPEEKENPFAVLQNLFTDEEDSQLN